MFVAFALQNGVGSKNSTSGGFAPAVDDLRRQACEGHGVRKGADVILGGAVGGLVKDVGVQARVLLRLLDEGVDDVLLKVLRRLLCGVVVRAPLACLLSLQRTLV